MGIIRGKEIIYNPPVPVIRGLMLFVFTRDDLIKIALGFQALQEIDERCHCFPYKMSISAKSKDKAELKALRQLRRDGYFTFKHVFGR